MNSERPASRRRETFLALLLAVGLACIIALYFLLVAGQYFLATLTVLGGLILLGFLQYLIWGRPMSRPPSNPQRTSHVPR
jgi:hypothetical protein